MVMLVCFGRSVELFSLVHSGQLIVFELIGCVLNFILWACANDFLVGVIYACCVFPWCVCTCVRMCVFASIVVWTQACVCVSSHVQCRRKLYLIVWFIVWLGLFLLLSFQIPLCDFSFRVQGRRGFYHVKNGCWLLFFVFALPAFETLLFVYFGLGFCRLSLWGGFWWLCVLRDSAAVKTRPWSFSVCVESVLIAWTCVV